MMTRSSTAETGTHEPIARASRMCSAVLGGWLFLSAFLWRHSPEQMISDALVGALVVAAALGALYVRSWLHVANVALSSWLLVSLIVLPGPSTATLISDLLVASLLFGFSVVPDGTTPST